jgi:hypothetical protein
MARKNGVDMALAKVEGETLNQKVKAVADLLGLTSEAIYKFRRQGWFPLERAKVVSATYELPLADLVRDDIRGALLANNS